MRYKIIKKAVQFYRMWMNESSEVYVSLHLFSFQTPILIKIKRRIYEDTKCKSLLYNLPQSSISNHFQNI